MFLINMTTFVYSTARKAILAGIAENPVSKAVIDSMKICHEVYCLRHSESLGMLSKPEERKLWMKNIVSFHQPTWSTALFAEGC